MSLIWTEDLTLQKNGHQWRSVAVLCLLDQQLSIVQHVGHRVAPFNDAVHDVAGVILLIGAKGLKETRGIYYKQTL